MISPLNIIPYQGEGDAATPAASMDGVLTALAQMSIGTEEGEEKPRVLHVEPAPQRQPAPATEPAPAPAPVPAPAPAEPIVA